MVGPPKGVPEPTELPGKYVDDINLFPGNREYLGTIIRTAGDQYKVFMPLVVDYADLDMKKTESMFRLGARSIGISYLEFQSWTFPDGQRVMNKLAEGIGILGDR